MNLPTSIMPPLRADYRDIYPASIGDECPCSACASHDTSKEILMQTKADVQTHSSLPIGEYAIVEVLGHRTLIGRVEEVERFGTKLLSIEPVFSGQLLPAVMIGGSSIYQFTPCSAEIAAARMPKEAWQLPPSVRAVLPLLAIEAAGDSDHDELPF